MANPSVHPGDDLKRPKRELETIAGKLEFARMEVQMGVPGAKERYEACQAEYERLRTSASLLKPF